MEVFVRKKIHVFVSKVHRNCMLWKLLLLGELLDGQELIVQYLYAFKASMTHSAQTFLKRLLVKDATGVLMGEIAPLQISVLVPLGGRDTTAGPQCVKS
jgi:hypothetical protein